MVPHKDERETGERDGSASMTAERQRTYHDRLCLASINALIQASFARGINHTRTMHHAPCTMHHMSSTSLPSCCNYKKETICQASQQPRAPATHEERGQQGVYASVYVTHILSRCLFNNAVERGEGRET